MEIRTTSGQIVTTFKKGFLCLLAIFFISSCTEQRMDNYNDLSIELTDQNGVSLTFPEDLHGTPLLMGFVYTNCPDICSFITANLYKVWQETGEPENVRFVLITFDPERDRPDVLKSYARAFDMDRLPFLFLTGDSESIEGLMERMGVRTQVSYTTETEEGEELYFLNHTDKILLIDDRGRLVMDYGGSMTPTRIFVEDLERLL